MSYEIVVPDSGFSVTEGTIIEWTKMVGEKVQEGETLVIIETDKVTVEIPALVTGVLVEIRFKEGDTVPVGAVLGLIAEERDKHIIISQELPASLTKGEEKAALPSGHEMAAECNSRQVKPAATFAKRKISPVARKLAEKQGIDVSIIETGSGPRGRIVKKDILRLAKMKEAGEPVKEREPAELATEDKIKLVGWRKVIADRMIRSARDIPQGQTLVEVDVTNLANLISSVKKRIENPKITYLPFLMKAIQAGIELTPEVNAYCYEDDFVLKRDINIGVAVEVGEKLVVPVVKRVKEKSILELAEEIQALAQKTREDRLRPEDVQGGTITVTNLGPFDVYAAMPLILPPQTTIVAMGTVRDQPWISGGSIEMRKKMMVTGVFDHRAVNGAPGARFLGKLKAYLEDLSNLILGLR